MQTIKTRTAATLAATALMAIASLPALASSHREAPFIAQQPSVDGTDFYLFRSYEPGRSNYVTMIADYIPLQATYGGPNFFQMNQNALYSIHIDNIGDGKEHLTFQFRFKNTLKDIALPIAGKQVSIPLINSGPIDTVNSPNLQVRETFTVTVVRGDGSHNATNGQLVTHAGTGDTEFDKPVDNIGNKSIADYAAYAAKHIYHINIPGCSGTGKMFVGQRKDPFVINLGETFDLINIKAPAVEFAANAESAAKDDLADNNVTSIALEVPISCLKNGSQPVIGAWTTASLRQDSMLHAAPKTGLNQVKTGNGPWVQVSRLGMPLVNELVIGLKDKDKFNASKPGDDAQFLDYVTHPTLATLIQSLFSSAGVKAPTKFPRNDLVATFLTGISGLNQPANVTPAEMMRLNTDIGAVPKGKQNRLGVIDGDNAGFPNGRRPGDDVPDIELRVVMGKLCTLNDPAKFGCAPADAPSGTIRFTDGAFTDDSHYDAAFPYLKTPLPGSPQQP